jgi:hypothetical protein
MLAPELAGEAIRLRIVENDDLVIGDMQSGVVAIAVRLEDRVIRGRLVVVDSLGHQGGQDVPRR